MERADSAGLDDQHEMMASQVASSNYKRLDIESAFSQHTTMSRKDIERVETKVQSWYGQRERLDRGAATAGVIEKIVLQNFMCHDYFELGLGPQLNFIIGRNGSGKSAVLTGISVGLGCKATETDRGKNLRDLVKRGAKAAKITIVFSNRGEYGYEHDKYGDQIVVERMLRVDGPGGYFIKSEARRTVTTKKADLDEMLDFFGITINNPLAFLSQGAAKTFLAASTDHDKYSFFMKGIQMEQTIGEYMHSNAQLSKIHVEIDAKSRNMHALREDADKARRAYRQFHESKSLRESKKVLSGRLIWLQIVSKESDVATLLAKSRELLRQIQQAAAQLSLQEQAIQELDKQMPQIVQSIEDKSAAMQTCVEKRAEIKQEMAGLGDQINAIQGRIEDCTKSNAKKQSRLKKIVRNIAAESARLQALDGGSKETVKEDIERLNGVKMDIKREQQRLSEEKNTLEQEIKGLYKEFTPLIENKHTELKKLLSIRKQLASSEKDKLAPYPERIKHVLAYIELQKHAFAHKPVGPIGPYMSLKRGYEKYHGLLEKVFSSVLDAFVVQTFEDQRRLAAVLRKHNLSNQIIIRKAERFKYDNNSRQDGLLRIIDVLEFDNEDVKYLLIDVAQIEHSVLQDDRMLATKLVQSNKQVRVCYSLFDSVSGAKYNVNPHTGAFRSDPVFYLDNHVLQLQTAGQSAQAEMLKIELKMDEKKLELGSLQNKYEQQVQQKKQSRSGLQEQYARNKQKLADLERQTASLQNQLDEDEDRTYLDALQEEKTSLEDEIVINDNTISGSNAELEELNEKFTALRQDFAAVQEQMKQVEREIRRLKTQLESGNEHKAQLADQMETQKRIQDKKQTIVDTIEQKIPMMQEQIEREIPNALRWCSREQASINLQTDRTEHIKRQIQIVNQQLSEVNRSIGKTEEQIIAEHHAKSAVYKHARQELLKAHALRDKLTKSIFNRMTAAKTQRDMLCLAADSDFSTSLQQRGFQGKLLFDFEKKSLRMLVGKDGRPPREVSSLSGGEKSYTQIALLLAIWKPMRSKIRGLDEFDVFMDNVNRRISMRLMLESLRKEPKSQTIFITPQDIGHVKGIDAADVCIHKLKDPVR